MTTNRITSILVAASILAGFGAATAEARPQPYGKGVTAPRVVKAKKPHRSCRGMTGTQLLKCLSAGGTLRSHLRV